MCISRQHSPSIRADVELAVGSRGQRHNLRRIAPILRPCITKYYFQADAQKPPFVGCKAVQKITTVLKERVKKLPVCHKYSIIDVCMHSVSY